jgi:hypothetical protein
MQKGAQPTYFREPHIIRQRTACDSRAAVWTPLVYIVVLVRLMRRDVTIQEYFMLWMLDLVHNRKSATKRDPTYCAINMLAT